mmetsp:Transcript_24653/g.53831  ORF Transcript_24653/g.53831 Transcript_24653/m.53831 type:complete len:128 (+) Transcript_24653:45-428(+)|eukprot:CAMPEP_0202920260 /NCGR_PEP_ID=MMETSP1392-20130828/76765_1 /ASSEMBLY_ACC=CAM_ASM_000868 /TAXON_ID=225041 /ORGANISM="Chlamydomonas chlamydogama, Strain SAG 11-48b" /LENGTH=127 /DNA_ID=CAMNT_0049613745 /DNA_START=45 /DNA_END=428 /DNA_ORIENTATION=+
MPRPPKAGAATPKGGKGDTVVEAKSTGGKGRKPGSAKSQAHIEPENDKANAVKELEERRRQTLEQLRVVEKQIYNLESQYFETANPQGNALKGYEGLLSTVAVSAKKSQFRAEDRIFSNSSVTGTSF